MKRSFRIKTTESCVLGNSEVASELKKGRLFVSNIESAVNRQTAEGGSP
jgi:hypothetical protein